MREQLELKKKKTQQNNKRVNLEVRVKRERAIVNLKKKRSIYRH